MARILVVDDEADMLSVMKLMLEMEGHFVITARDGREAIEKVDSEKPDLMITDFMMPGMDGLELCARLRNGNDEQPIPVILSSAAADPPKENGGLFYAFLRKPVQFDALLSVIEELLPRRG
jgi:CheY-like chemotaxis protein